MDVGCADGDSAFFLESLGYEMRAIDYSATNQNRMQGIRALRERLNSRIQVLDEDLDSRAEFPGYCGLALTLGLIYHLAKPVSVSPIA
jgi:tRNA (mo5U34)-methyltransferase